MNHIHRLVWNERIGAFVAVGETTSRRGKRSGVSGALVAAALLGAGLSQAHAQAAPPHQALPKGGQVVAGQARLSTSGNTLDVQQTSQKAIINWQSFNIGADAKVNFSQPNAASVALNRVVGTDPSAIFGSLTSNGQVFLLNPNGVLFGAGARVDVGGLAATTMALSDADFLAGRYRFTEGRASVVNEGDLSAHDGGYIALMAPEVINGGVVNATLGTVALAAGNAVTLQTEGALAFTIDQGALDALVENHQAIRADGGHVLIGAQSSAALQRAVIRNDGLIEARGARSVGGVIRLEAGTIASSGTIDASGLGTDGGSVELRAGTGAGGSVTVAGGVAATGARGGNIVITGNTVELLGAQVNASGDHGGGQVLLGGGAQGQDALVENASHTLVDAGSQVHADALRDGAGGQVVAWADQRSVIAGTLTARGGAGGGDGGAIETSGKVSLDLAGAHVDASAPAGRDGRWLLDPSDITITHGATGALAGGLFDPGTSSSIGDAQINGALNGGTNVTIQTSSGTGGSGSIVVNGNSDSGGAVVIANASGGTRSLSLTADGSIDIHSGASLAGTTGNALDVHLSAVGGNTVSGTIDNAGGTTTFGGALTLNGTIRNGTLAGTDATPLLQSNNGRLDGMTVGGTSLSASGSVFVLNDLALANGVDLAITNSNWYFDGQNTGQAAGTVHHLSTLGAATIDLIGSNLNLYAVNGQTLDIGAGITIQGSGSLNETWNGNTLQNTVTNAGTIIATGVNQALSFNVDAFVNTGTVAASGGGALYVNNAFTNSGVVHADGGAVNLNGTWTNPGKVIVDSGALNLGGTFTTADLTGAAHFERNGGDVNITGTLDNTGTTLDIGSAGLFGAGGLTSLNNGRILNGTVLDTDATPVLQSNNGRLDGVTLAGTNFGASGSLYVWNDLTLASGVDLAITNSNWYFDGQDVNQGAGVVHHLLTPGAATLDLVGSNLYIFSTFGQTLDIGAGVTIRGYGSLTQYWGGNTIVNNGAIIANVSGQGLGINPDVFNNTGSVAATDGGTLEIAGQFTNSGVAHVDGGSLNIDATWTNPGKVIVDSGALNLGGTVATAELTGATHFERNGGDVNITGTLDNTGTTLDIGSAGLFGTGGLTSLNNGRILNGTVLDTDATPVLQSNNGKLDGVTLAGTNFGASGSLYVWNDLTLASGVDLAITNSNWYFDGQDVNQGAGVVHHLLTSGAATVDLNGSNLYIFSTFGQTLDIGSGVTIRGYGSLTQYWGGNTIVNNGAIIANVSGQGLGINPDVFNNTGSVTATNGATLEIAGQFANSGVAHVDGGSLNIDASWTNPGKVIVDSGALNLGGTVATAELTGATHFERNGGDVNITGTLDNTGATLDIGSAGLFGPGGLTSLNNGRILNGTVLDTDATPVLQSNNGKLDGVTLAGTNFGASGSLYVWNDLTLASGVDVAITNSNWYFDGQDVNQGAGVVHQLLTPGTATLDLNGSNLYIFSTFGQTLDIGAGITVRGYGSLTQYWGGNTIVNNGTLSSNTAGQSLRMDTDYFVDNGNIHVAGGAYVDRPQGFTSSGILSGSGTIRVGTGANRLVNAGVIDPGGTGATGTLHVDGDLQLAAGSTTNVELAGTQAGQFDALAVTGTVTGDTGSSGSSFGALNVSRINGFFFVDAAGDHYDLLRAASGADSGSFGSATVARATVSASYAPARATLTVVPDMLTVTADPLSKVYGQADPGFTWSATGFDGGDNAANALTGAIGRTAGKDVGYYDYQPGTLVSPLGYAIQFTSGPQFQITPASITLTAQSSTKVYDGGYAAPASATVAAGALFYGDNLSGGTFTFADKNVGAGKTVSTSGVSVGDGVHDANYNVSYVDSTSSSITPYVVNLTGARVYDATIGVAANWLAMGTLPAGETLSLSGSASLGTKDVGAGKSATAGSLALVSGTGLATNYTLVGSAIEVDVTPRSIVVGGVGASNKTYDATTAATLTGTASVTALGSDDLGLAGAPSAQFVDKNAGASKAVVVSGYALSGADAGNYAIVQPTGLAATITPASLSVTGVAAASKVYDATTAATLNGTASVVALGSDDVTVSGGAGSFVDKNVGNSKAVTASGFALAGADAGNYVVVQPTGLAANITPATLAVGGVTAVNRVYDATTAATLNGTASVAALGSDDVTVNGGAGSFVDKNVGTSKAVTATGFALAGADAGNYVLVQPTGLAANITPATLAVSGVTAVNKVYDATTAATLNGTASVAALGSDDVTVSGGAGSFVDKNVGTGKAVTATGFALAGADAGNYVLVQPIGLAANITPAALVVSGITAANKTYDGTTSATLSGGATVSALAGDSVTVGGSGQGLFASAGVANGVAVSVSGYALQGADAGNYQVVQPTGLAANIMAAAPQVVVTAPVLGLQPPPPPPASASHVGTAPIQVAATAVQVDPAVTPMSASTAGSTPTADSPTASATPTSVSAAVAGPVTLAVPVGLGADFVIALPPGATGASNGAVVREAIAEDGGPLPSWLTYTPQSRTFSGKVPPGLKTLTVRVVLADGQVLPVRLTFSGTQVDASKP